MTNLCDLRSLIFSRSTLNDQGQAASLETKKVIDAAIKDTSSSLAATLTKDLELLFYTGIEESGKSEEGKKLDVWPLPRGTENVSNEAYLSDLADFIIELGCNKNDAPFVARWLILNSRVQDLGPFAAPIEAKFLDDKFCPGAAGLTNAEKGLLANSIEHQKSDQRAASATPYYRSASSTRSSLGRDDRLVLPAAFSIASQVSLPTMPSTVSFLSP